MTLRLGLPEHRSDWTVLIPVKSIGSAKSRFTRLQPADRRALVLAMATDVIETALACDQVRNVAVVSPDIEVLATLARDRRVHLIRERASGLNSSLTDALTCLGRLAPGPIAAVTADVPALTSGELGAALALALHSRASFVPDAQGSGTTVFATKDASAFRPRFGPSSKDAHIRAGCKEIAFDDTAGIRIDVDDMSGLFAALSAGAGRHTRSVTAELLLADDPVASGNHRGVR